MGGLSVQTYPYYNEQFKSASVAACIGRAKYYMFIPLALILYLEFIHSQVGSILYLWILTSLLLV